MNHLLAVPAACSLLILGSASLAGEMDDGKALAKKHLCVECHGLSGNSDIYNERRLMSRNWRVSPPVIWSRK